MVTKFSRPSHPPGSSIHTLEYPDHLQVPTPRRVYDTLAKRPLCAGGHTRRGPPAGAGGLIPQEASSKPTLTAVQDSRQGIHGTETIQQKTQKAGEKYPELEASWIGKRVERGTSTSRKQKKKRTTSIKNRANQITRLTESTVDHNRTRCRSRHMGSESNWKHCHAVCHLFAIFG